MTNAHQPDRLDRIEAILAQVATAQQTNTTAISELRQENARANAELRQSIADLRQENAEANAELRQSIADLRQENATAITELRQENAADNERLRQRIEQNSAANAELRQSIADLRQENAEANAQMRRDNAEANAELRREIKANIDDVSAMIFDGLAETKKITDSNARAVQAWEQRLETERDETITVEVDTLNAIQTLQSGQDGLRTDVQSLTHFVRDGFNLLGQTIVGLRQELSAQIQSLIDITRDNTGRITRLEDENPGSS